MEPAVLGLGPPLWTSPDLPAALGSCVRARLELVSLTSQDPPFQPPTPIYYEDDGHTVTGKALLFILICPFTGTPNPIHDPKTLTMVS
jgi:hypothetical protein